MIAIDSLWIEVCPIDSIPLRGCRVVRTRHVQIALFRTASDEVFALDNRWLAAAGYEVTPHRGLGFNACLARGGKYQIAFKEAALKYAKEAKLAHMKFDGFVPRCDEPSHGHPTGVDSYLPLAEGLMEVFDALRSQNPDIALEPTCFGSQPSPWWLMHVPFIIGPFGDDSPYGRCPAPDYLEAMTTAREIKNLRGRGDGSQIFV